MNILQLRYFATVARLESISKASELLFVSQSALSKNISKLEDELGIPLFTRKGKRLLLNAQGVRFLESCTRVLQEVDDAVAEIAKTGRDNVKHISVCAVGTCRPLMDAIASFHAAYPNIAFSVDSCSEDAELPDINSYDVIIYPAGGRYAKYSGSHFYTERYCLLLSRTHPLARQESVDLQALAGQDVVFLRSEDGSSEFPYMLSSALHIPFRSRCFADDPVQRLRLVSGGLAAAFATESECAAFRQDSSLCVVPVEDTRFSRQMMICFRREKHLSKAAKLFREHLIDRFHLTPTAENAEPAAH